MIIHLFTVQLDTFEPPTLDTLLCIDTTDTLLMMDTQTFEAAKELSHIPEETISGRNEITNFVAATEMRLRFSSSIYHRMLRLDVNEELSRDDMTALLQSYDRKTLQTKLKKWEFK